MSHVSPFYGTAGYGDGSLITDNKNELEFEVSKFPYRPIHKAMFKYTTSEYEHTKYFKLFFLY